MGLFGELMNKIFNRATSGEPAAASPASSPAAAGSPGSGSPTQAPAQVASQVDVAAILDWEDAVIGPREHDVWIAAEGPHLEPFLAEYGAHDLDLDHLEYALLARGLRDMSARVLGEVDQPGVVTWGFDRIARVDSDLKVFREYCG